MTVSVAKRSPVLTLTGPTTAEAGKRLRLSGSLTLDGRAPSPAATLQVYRAIYNNRQDGVTYQLAGRRGHRQPRRLPVLRHADPGRALRLHGPLGRLGDVRGGVTDHEVTVSSTASQLTAIVEQPAFVNEPFWVGGVSFDVAYCVGPTTIHVTRQIGTGTVERRPDPTTDENCSFRFSDVLTLPAAHHWGHHPEPLDRWSSSRRGARATIRRSGCWPRREGSRWAPSPPPSRRAAAGWTSSASWRPAGVAERRCRESDRGDEALRTCGDACREPVGVVGALVGRPAIAPKEVPELVDGAVVLCRSRQPNGVGSGLL